eukprot:7380477-Prymnesium_polylepis.3
MFTPAGVHADKAELFNIWLAERQSAEEAAGSTGADGAGAGAGAAPKSSSRRLPDPVPSEKPVDNSKASP